MKAADLFHSSQNLFHYEPRGLFYYSSPRLFNYASGNLFYYAFRNLFSRNLFYPSGLQSQGEISSIQEKKAEASETRAEVYDLRSFTHPTHTRIVIDCSQVREYNTLELREPDRLAVDVLSAQLNPLLHGKQIPVQTAYLTRIRLAQRTPTIVRLTADLDWRLIERTNIFTLYDPFRIVIDIYPRSGQAQKAVVTEAEESHRKRNLSSRPSQPGLAGP